MKFLDKIKKIRKTIFCICLSTLLMPSYSQQAKSYEVKEDLMQSFKVDVLKTDLNHDGKFSLSKETIFCSDKIKVNISFFYTYIGESKNNINVNIELKGLENDYVIAKNLTNSNLYYIEDDKNFLYSIKSSFNNDILSIFVQKGKNSYTVDLYIHNIEILFN